MGALVSHYPRVSEWLYVGDTAINLATVISITFNGDSAGEYAVLRLPASGDRRDDDVDRDWLEVRDVAVIRQLRHYIEQAYAPAAAASR